MRGGGATRVPMSRMAKPKQGPAAVHHRDRGDLDIDRRAELAPHGRGKQPHRPALAQVGGQHLHLDAGLAQPALELLAHRLLLGGELRHLEEGGIGGQHPAVLAGDDEGIRHALDQLQQLRLGLGQHDRPGLALRIGQPHQHQAGVLLAEGGGGDQHLAAILQQPRPHVVGPAGGPDAGHQLVDRPLALGREHLEEDPRGAALAAAAEQRVRRAVRLQHLLRGALQDQHRLGPELEQHAVAGLGVAQPGVVPVDRLLRLDQSLLQGRERPQVAAEGDHPAAVADPHGGEEDRHRGAAQRTLVDVAPARQGPGGDVAQHGLHLRPAVLGHRVHPGAAEPALLALHLQGQLLAVEGGIPDHARLIDDEGDIRRGGDQDRCGFRIQIAQRCLRGFERLHGWHIPSSKRA